MITARVSFSFSRLSPLQHGLIKNIKILADLFSADAGREHNQRKHGSHWLSIIDAICETAPAVIIIHTNSWWCIFLFPVNRRYTNVYRLIHGFSSPRFLSILMLHSACTLLFEEVLPCSPAAVAASRLRVSYEEQALRNHRQPTFYFPQTWVWFW